MFTVLDLMTAFHPFQPLAKTICWPIAEVRGIL